MADEPEVRDDSAVTDEEVQKDRKPLERSYEEGMLPLTEVWGAGAKPMATAYSEELPSRGVLYKNEESGEPLLPGGRIALRPLTSREEGILYGQSDPVEKMHKMVAACITSKEIKPDDLLTIDQFFLLFSLRVHSFGSEYNIPISCSRCNEQTKVKLDLVNEFSIKYMSATASEPFYTTLPVCNRKVGFRLQRVKDQFRIRQYAKRMRMQTVDAGDPSHLYRLAIAIMELENNDGVMEEVTHSQALEFVQKMLMADSNHFQNEITRVEGGVDTRIYADCTQCGYTNKMRMPFDLEFFRPGAV